jgi:hypothetical protein
MMGNMLRRGERSWLCMKFKFAFFAGNGILIKVLPPSCLTPMRFHAFVLHIFRKRFPTGFLGFGGAVVRFAYEISCCWVISKTYSKNMNSHKKISYNNYTIHFLFFCRCKIMRVHAFQVYNCFLAVTRYSYEMSWFVNLKRFHEISF